MEFPEVLFKILGMPRPTNYNFLQITSDPERRLCSLHLNHNENSEVQAYPDKNYVSCLSHRSIRRPAQIDILGGLMAHRVESRNE